MNRPTDEQIDKVLAGMAAPEDARYVAEWFATEEGSDYLETAMTRDVAQINKESAVLYVDHEIPSGKMFRQIEGNIRHKRVRKFCLRAAVVLIPVICLISFCLYLDSRVNLFGTTEYEEVIVAKGERVQMMFQDGTRVYVNSESKLRYPKKFALNKREVFLEGEAYFMVSGNKYRPFVVNLNGPVVNVLGTAFDVQNYPESKDIIVHLDEGHINLALPSKQTYDVYPGDKLVYNKESKQCTITKTGDMLHTPSMWRQNVIIFKDSPLEEVIQVLNRWYDVEFKVEDARAWKYLYTLTVDDSSLKKVLTDLEKIAPVSFKYLEEEKKVVVKVK